MKIQLVKRVLFPKGNCLNHLWTQTIMKRRRLKKRRLKKRRLKKRRLKKRRLKKRRVLLSNRIYYQRKKVGEVVLIKLNRV